MRSIIALECLVQSEVAKMFRAGSLRHSPDKGIVLAEGTKICASGEDGSASDILPHIAQDKIGRW